MSGQKIAPLSTWPEFPMLLAELHDSRSTACWVITDQFEEGFVNIEAFFSGTATPCRLASMLAAGIELFAKKFHDGDRTSALRHIAQHLHEDGVTAPIHMPAGRA